jgi:hypothetical protein
MAIRRFAGPETRVSERAPSSLTRCAPRPPESAALRARPPAELELRSETPGLFAMRPTLRQTEGLNLPGPLPVAVLSLDETKS